MKPAPQAVWVSRNVSRIVEGTCCLLRMKPWQLLALWYGLYPVASVA